MLVLYDIILPVFVVIGFGYILTWRGLFSAQTVDALVKFTQNFAIPCLLFRAISEIDLGASLSLPLLVSFYLGAFLCFFLGYFGARRFFNRNPVEAISIGFCCLFSNSVLLGLPITERAYGTNALSANYAIIAFHAPLCYLLGVSAMEIARNQTAAMGQKITRVLRAMFRNALVIGIGLGLLVNLTSVPLPTVFLDGLDLVAQAALPAALFSLGGVLAQYRPEGDLKTILMICAISLLVHPTITYGIGTAAGLETAALKSAVLTAAMAPGVNAYVFSYMYDGAKRVSAASVLMGTAFSVITAWVWLSILG